MKNIKEYNLEELKEEMTSLGEKPYRAEQIFKWIYKDKVKEFDEMTNLSIELREKLQQNYTMCNFKILKKQESSDGTKKYLFDVLDGNAIETVLMQYHHGKTICVSSQIGCKMGCKFCASTGINFVRSLTSGEIVEQILAVEQDTGVRISNVVFMGIGEPLDNYDNVIKAIKITLPEEEKGKYSHRNYLGGIVKLGMKREKVGDILVSDDGADILVKAETAETLKQELGTLTRFENSKIEIIELQDVRKPEIKLEEITIIVPSLRLDNFVSDLARTSRSKAVQIIDSERVFINGQNETKSSKQVKLGDVITIRGKGRFVVKEFGGNTRSGRTVVKIEKYV